MQIKSLHIKNFNNIKDMFLEFSSGINLFSGTNGQGKSSIFEAITYILTDTLNEPIKEYVRRGEESFELHMVFSHLGHDYDYTIKGTNKGSTKELVVDKSEIFNNSEATKKMASVINPKLTLYTAIAEQGKNVNLLSDTPTNRLKRLKEILGADKLELIIDHLKNDIKENIIKSDTIKETIKKLEEREFVYYPIPELEDISVYELLYEELKKEKILYESQLHAYNTYLDSLKSYEENEAKKEKIKEEIFNENKKLKELENIYFEENVEDVVKDLSKKENEYNTLKLKQDAAIKEYDAYVKSKKELEDNKSKYENDLSELKLSRLSKCSVSQDDIDNLEKSKQECLLKISQIKSNIELAKQGKCPTCGKTFDFNSDELEVEEKVVCGDLNILQSEIKERKKVIEDYNKKVQANEIISAKRKVIQSELDKVIDRLSNLEEPVFIEKVIDYDILIKDVKKILIEKEIILKEKQNHINDLKSIQNNIDTNNKILESINIISEPKEVKKPKEFDEVQYNNVKTILNNHKEKVKEVEGLKLHNEKEKEKEIQNEKDIREKRREYNEFQKTISILEESKNLLDKKFSSYLINKGSEFIKEQMNEFFQNTYDKYEITFEQTKNSIGFYYSDDKGTSPCAKASGWEKAIMSVSFRVALCPLQNLNLLLLDEIDSDSYPENSLKFYKILIETLRDNQFCIITHKDETKEFLSNTNNVKVFEIKEGELVA